MKAVFVNTEILISARLEVLGFIKPECDDDDDDDDDDAVKNWSNIKCNKSAWQMHECKCIHRSEVLQAGVLHEP